MKQALEKAKPPKSREEYLAIKTLQIDTRVIILPVDKGNAKMVMDNLGYFKKLSWLVEDDSYIKNKSEKRSKS